MFGYQWKTFEIDSCDSTNAYLKQCVINNDAQIGSVLLSKNQTAGRGRMNRTWEAPSGNISMSLVIPAPKNIENIYQINLVAGLSLAKTISYIYNVQTKIKWPNDVLIRGKKIAGILSEYIPEKNLCILGVGINFNSQKEDFTQELFNKITTLKHETQRTLDLKTFLEAFLKQLRVDLNAFMTRGLADLLLEINGRLAFCKENIQLREDEEIYTAKLMGLDHNGLIRVMDKTNHIKSLINAEIVMDEKEKIAKPQNHLLVIDVGNTNMALGLYSGDILLANWRLETKKERTSDELGVFIRELLTFSNFKLEEIKKITISNVVPPLTYTLTEMCRTYFQTEPFFVTHNIKSPINIRLDNPKEIGADRLVNAVAAYSEFKTDLIVIDFGTATTFDYIDCHGSYRGGSICPGIKISSDALFHRASKLPRVEITRPDKVIGANTIDCMQSGLYFGYLGLIDSMVERMQSEIGKPVKVIATGGLANLIAKDSTTITTVDEDLTLKGLKLLYKINKEQ